MSTYKTPPTRKFVRTNRPLDFIYDPLYTVPSRPDFEKNALQAAMGEAKYKLQPVYDSFFSDSYKFRRIKACYETKQPNFLEKFLPQYEIEGIPVYPMDKGPPFQYQDDVTGADRAKYFIRYVPANLASNYQLEAEVAKLVPPPPPEREGPRTRSIGTQTILREIETQTEPYSPPYVLPNPDDYPKVLALIKMTWGKGLPATLDDIVTIERALSRRLIELSDRENTSKEDFIKRVKTMERLEAQQWLDRDRELDKIRRMKSHIVQRQLQEIRVKMVKDQTTRLNKMFETRKAANVSRFHQIKLDYLRQLRKLERKYRSGDRTFKRDVVLDYLDMESSIYAPLARNGRNIDQLGYAPEYQFTVHRDYETLTYLTDMESFVKKHLTFDLKEFSKKIKAIRPPKSVQKVEKRLQDCFEAFRDVCKPNRNSGEDEMLNSMIMKSVRRLSTPEKELDCDDNEEEEAIVILQTLIRGRAVQSLLRQEAENNMDTILQLRDAYESDPFGSLQPLGEKLAIKQQQRELASSDAQNNAVDELVQQVEGEALAYMMDFLEKEMTRLLDERKIHALCMMAERERRMLEAAEAGRREKEEDCMRANDEIWRQVIGVHQQTIDMYLEDIYLESVHRVADEGARKHVQKLARTVNDAAYNLEANIESVDKDEIAADLVHSFLFPQVSRENAQRKVVDLHGRYYAVATQVTEAILNSKGMVQEVLDIIGPELTKRFQEGEDVVQSSLKVVDEMIHDAVRLVVSREKDRRGGSSMMDDEYKYKRSSQGISDDAASESTSQKINIKPIIRTQSERKLGGDESHHTGAATPDGAESATDKETTTSLKSKLKRSVSEVKFGQVDIDEFQEWAEEEHPGGEGKGPKKGNKEEEKAKKEGRTKEEEMPEINPTKSLNTLDKGVEAKSKRKLPPQSLGVSPEEEPKEKNEEEEALLLSCVEGNLNPANVAETKAAAHAKAEEELKDPTKIPIFVPEGLSELIGIKSMEIHSHTQEVTETSAKVFDAACRAVQDIFDGVQDVFVESDEVSDEELDDDDPDMD